MSEKQVCLLTGAAGGLGRAILQRLIVDGYHVVATDLKADQIKEAVQDITARLGVNSDRILAMALDVRSMKAWSLVWDRAIARFGAVDILINNAGVLQPSYVADLTPQSIDLQIDVNTKGTLYGMSHAARYMQSRRRGHIINIASLAGISPVPGMSVYSASKFAVRSASLAAARELREYGVAVSVVCPDGIATAMVDDHRHRDEAAMIFSAPSLLQAEDVAQIVVKKVLVSRPVEVLIPTARGWLAKLGGAFPALYTWLAPLFIRMGISRQRKFHNPV